MTPGMRKSFADSNGEQIEVEAYYGGGCVFVGQEAFPAPVVAQLDPATAALLGLALIEAADLAAGSPQAVDAAVDKA